jgi:hypothetical protein
MNARGASVPGVFGLLDRLAMACQLQCSSAWAA